MKKKLIIFTVLTSLLLAGFLFWRTKGDQPTAATQETVASPVEVEVRPCIEAFGLVKGTEVMNINVDFPARVSKLYVKEGQKVGLGEALLALDLEEYRTEIRNTEYELQLAHFERKKEEKVLAQLVEELNRKTEELETNRDYELNKLRSDLAQAQQDLKTKKTLFAAGAITSVELKELEKAVSDLQLSVEHLQKEKAEALRKLEAELTLKIPLEDQLTSDRHLTSINLQKAKITLLEEKLQMLRKKIDQDFIRNNEIISNLKNSVVCEIGYAEGDLLTVERKVLSLIDLDSLIVKANVAEEFIKDVRPGAEVLITPVADYSRSYRGEIIRLADLAIAVNGETVIPVEISIKQQDDFLLPNFNVDVMIYTDQS